MATGRESAINLEASLIALGSHAAMIQSTLHGPLPAQPSDPLRSALACIPMSARFNPPS
jgi:hypothetical protein